MRDFLLQILSGDRDAIILVAAGYFIVMGVIAMVNIHRLSRWPSVIGALHEESVARWGAGGFSPDDRTYNASVRYTYSVNGVTYEGNRLNAWYVLVSHNLRFLLKYQFKGIERHAGQDVTVFYNPRKPQKSYLDVPGWRSMIFTAVICFGAAALIFSAL